jgi:GNAT superfamily N-acetyltransferase
VRLRWINLAGALAFTIYGVWIESIPVALLNLLIVGINVWYLVRSHRSREAFRVVAMDPESDYVREFLAVHDQEIRRFQPGFRLDADRPDQHVLVTLRDLVPAGLVIGTRSGADFRIGLDYVAPRYRDFKVGTHLFRDRSDVFRSLGVGRLLTAGGAPDHVTYLERIGFRQEGDDYVLDIRRVPEAA